MPYTLITGATGGMGKEFSGECAVRGMNLFLTGRSSEKLEKLKNEIKSMNDNIDVQIFPCALDDENSRKEMFTYAKQNGYKFERLINVAGADIQKAFSEYTQEKLVFQARVNFEAAVSITKFVIESRTDKLQILTVSSLCGTVPMPYFALYSATKAALINFFTAMRYEISNADITVLAPGSVPTREDIKKDIKLQGITGRLSSKNPSFVVKTALDGLNKNKRLVIPGFYNKLVYFAEKISPLKLQMKIIAKKFCKKEKDAF